MSDRQFQVVVKAAAKNLGAVPKVGAQQAIKAMTELEGLGHNTLAVRQVNGLEEVFTFDQMREAFNALLPYGYSINLDERGDFYADVRDCDGATIFEIKAGASLGECESNIFEDGYMKDKNDLAGLKEYLVELGILPSSATLLPLAEQEKQLDEQELVIADGPSELSDESDQRPAS